MEKRSNVSSLEGDSRALLRVQVLRRAASDPAHLRMVAIHSVGSSHSQSIINRAGSPVQMPRCVYVTKLVMMLVPVQVALKRSLETCIQLAVLVVDSMLMIRILNRTATVTFGGKRE